MYNKKGLGGMYQKPTLTRNGKIAAVVRNGPNSKSDRKGNGSSRN